MILPLLHYSFCQNLFSLDKPVFTQRDRWLKMTVAKLKFLNLKRIDIVSGRFELFKRGKICSECCLIPWSYPLKYGTLRWARPGWVFVEAFQMAICFLKRYKDWADWTNRWCPKPRVSLSICPDIICKSVLCTCPSGRAVWLSSAFVIWWNSYKRLIL